MAHDPKAVANYLLDCAKEDGETLSPMKLIKLVYLAHGWHLGLLTEPLIKENVEAWRYGPVMPSLYHDFKDCGNDPIDRYAKWPEMRGGIFAMNTPTLTTAVDNTLAILKQTWQVYKRFSAVQLSAMTHQKGTPWYTTYYERGGQDRLGVDIQDDLIQEHFEKLAAQRQ